MLVGLNRQDLHLTPNRTRTYNLELASGIYKLAYFSAYLILATLIQQLKYRFNPE